MGRVDGWMEVVAKGRADKSLVKNENHEEERTERDER